MSKRSNGKTPAKKSPAKQVVRAKAGRVVKRGRSLAWFAARVKAYGVKANEKKLQKFYDDKYTVIAAVSALQPSAA